MSGALREGVATRGRIALRLGAAVFVLAGTALVAVVIATLPRRGVRHAVAGRVIPWCCRALLTVLGIRVERVGPRPPAGSLVAANHLSWLDIVVALASWRCTFVAKHEVRHWPVVGALGDALGVVWIERRRARDLVRVIPLLESALRRGRRVVVFPEGTTTDGRSVLPFRSALFESAVRANAVMVPVSLSAGSTTGDVDALTWHGTETLVANIARLAALGGACVRVHTGAPVAAGTLRKPLARDARRHVLRRFRAVQNLPETARSHPEHASARSTPAPTLLGSVMRSGRTTLAVLSYVAGGTIAAVLLGVAALYIACPFYLEPDTQAFRGRHWYNPYADIEVMGGRWRDANFHAHAVAWGGLTNGRQASKAVAARYRTLGYEIVGISDYHVSPTRQPRGVFPVYEHGWNIQKAHRLVLGGGPVSYLDYPLGQNRHQRQHVLDRLRANAPLVAVAHPRLRSGHPAEVLPRLAGYDLLEVFNHFTPPADAEWDAALSAGHPVWLLANDDSHDIDGSDETGVSRTRVFSRDASSASVIDALRAGRAYGLHRALGPHALTLLSQRMRGDTFEVRVRGPLLALRVVGTNGVIRAERVFRHATPMSEFVVRWPARRDDTYLRAVAVGLDGALLYTNPAIRWNGLVLPHAVAQIDRPRTMLWRASWAIALFWVLAFASAARRVTWRPTYA